MSSEENYKNHVISKYTNEVNTDQQGRITLTRWRVSIPVGGSPDFRRILRDNLVSVEQARMYIDQKGQSEHP